MREIRVASSLSTGCNKLSEDKAQGTAFLITKQNYLLHFVAFLDKDFTVCMSYGPSHSACW